MCRFLAYVGRPIILDELLIKPVNSLINQSYDAEEMSEPLNGDGFGLGWYVKSIRPVPGLFRSITPAWNNQNLLYNTPLIKTDCVFAHVRAASEGTVNELNCHPFHYKEYLMMHNGGIQKFSKIKRQLLNRLDEEFFQWITGQTDSEHTFALLLQNLKGQRTNQSMDHFHRVYEGFRKTIQTILDLKQKAHIADEIVTLNMLITDGNGIYGIRYSSKPDKDIPTLYYSTGTKFENKDGESRMLREKDSHHKVVMVVSEKLTFIEEDWKPIPPNYFIGIDENKEVRLLPL